eukprot:ANDGO_02001.mRNA.1 Isopentenyl-diphosphate Delta-isomerase 2
MQPMQEEELFEIVDEANNVVGISGRSEVHKSGLFHRSVNVFLFSADRQRILLQKRSDSKDVCPGLWDLSCAEHLKPGESYRDAAIRGLSEELSVVLENPGDALQEAHDPFLFEFRDVAKNVWDREFQGLFAVVYDGPVQLDGVEVSALRWESVSTMDSELCHSGDSADRYTPWFRQAWMIWKTTLSKNLNHSLTRQVVVHTVKEGKYKKNL